MKNGNFLMFVDHDWNTARDHGYHHSRGEGKAFDRHPWGLFGTSLPNDEGMWKSPDGKSRNQLLVGRVFKYRRRRKLCDVLGDMASVGFRPATLLEMCEMPYAVPDYKVRSTMAALGTTTRAYGELRYPIMTRLEADDVVHSEVETNGQHAPKGSLVLETMLVWGGYIHPKTGDWVEDAVAHPGLEYLGILK